MRVARGRQSPLTGMWGREGRGPPPPPGGVRRRSHRCFLVARPSRCSQLADYEAQAAAAAGRAGSARVGDYSIVRELGRGTFGRVVLVQHRLTGELAAIKLLPRGVLVRGV